MTLHKYEVGQLYSKSRTRWPEAVDYNYRSGGHEMRMFYQAPSARDVDEIRNGACEFALVVEEPVILLLYRFGNTPWSDAPFSWWLVPEDERQMPNPEPAENERTLLQVVLVDADTGIIRAQRAVSWSPEFSAAMHAAIRRQASQPFDASNFDRTLSAQYRRFPSPDAMLPKATARTAGGG